MDWSLECTHGIFLFDHELSGNLTFANSVNSSSSSSDLFLPLLWKYQGSWAGYTEKDFGLRSQLPTKSFRHTPGTSLFVSLLARIPTPFFGLEFPGFTAAIWHRGELIPFATWTWSGAAFDDIRISNEEVYIAMRSSRRGRRYERIIFGAKYRLNVTDECER